MGYNPSIPAANDIPSQSQGQIQTNFSVLNTAFSVNHVAYSSTGQGKHNFVEMPNQTVIPSPVISGEGTIYTKAVSAVSQVFYTPDNSGDQYQMTRVNHTNFSLFGTNTTYAASLAGGWTFLPGGMIMQYGLVSGATSGAHTVNFPVAFTNPAYSLVITPIRNSSNVDIIYSATTAGTGSFTYRNTASGISQFYWMAIGV